MTRTFIEAELISEDEAPSSSAKPVCAACDCELTPANTYHVPLAKRKICLDCKDTGRKVGGFVLGQLLGLGAAALKESKRKAGP